MIVDDLFMTSLPRFRVRAADFAVPEDALYIHAGAGVGKSRRAPRQAQVANLPEKKMSIFGMGHNVVSTSQDGTTATLPLATLSDASRLLGDAEKVIIDITSLPLEIWAPLIAASKKEDRECSAVYQEPDFYQQSAEPLLGWDFDLSLEFSQLNPVPGFFTAQAVEVPQGRQALVPILGFEGQRLEGAMESLSEDAELVPIVGAPGYQVDYVFFALDANRHTLRKRVKPGGIYYARAGCPFETFFALCEISQAYAEYRLQVVPLGTKPSSLGSILFALAARGKIDLLHDRAVRRPGMASGSGVLSVFNLHQFWGTSTYESVEKLLE